MKLKSSTDKEITSSILKFVSDEYMDGRPKTLFSDLCDHINRKYVLESVTEIDTAIRCFDLKDVGFLSIYDLAFSNGGISTTLEKGKRPAVIITGPGLDYVRIVLK